MKSGKISADCDGAVMSYGYGFSVSPGAKERLVQITGPNEENVK